MPEHLARELQPWFGDDLDVSTVRLLDRGPISALFGMLGQWAVTWNGAVHLTARAPFWVDDEGFTARGESKDSDAAKANALWIIAHECLHVQQQRQMGWGRYLVAYASEWLRHRGELGNKFEGPAYELGDRVYQDFMKRLAGP